MPAPLVRSRASAGVDGEGGNAVAFMQLSDACPLRHSKGFHVISIFRCLHPKLVLHTRCVSTACPGEYERRILLIAVNGKHSKLHFRTCSCLFKFGNVPVESRGYSLNGRACGPWIWSAPAPAAGMVSRPSWALSPGLEKVFAVVLE